MIRQAKKTDISLLAGLAVQLWPAHTVSELENEFENIMRSGDAAFFILFDDGKPAGFAQCQLRRDYVEGAQSSPVGYLEGIFVAENYRKKGYGKQLLNKCEEWARTKGCLEFAGDCEYQNAAGFDFHIKNGFNEANRIICFIKKL